MPRLFVGLLAGVLAVGPVAGGAAAREPRRPRPSATPAPRPAEPPNFVSVCAFSHELPDDPIVYPGQPGASHLHTFFGNTSTDASSTYESLQAAGTTTCQIPADIAAYWTPALYDDGVEVRPRLVRAYYQTGGKRFASIEPFPAGLKVVTSEARAIRWACVGGDSDGEGETSIPTCPEGQFLVLRIAFQDCWDGANLDSADHRSHMTYNRMGRCPATHPVPVPRLLLAVRYPGSDGGNITLAPVDNPSAPHADFFNAWRQDELERLVKVCLNAGVHCGARPPGA